MLCILLLQFPKLSTQDAFTQLTLSGLKQPYGWVKNFPCPLWNKSLRSLIWWPELVLILPGLRISSLWNFHQDSLSKLVMRSNFYSSIFISILSVGFAIYIHKNNFIFLLVILNVSRTKNIYPCYLLCLGSLNPNYSQYRSIILKMVSFQYKWAVANPFLLAWMSLIWYFYNNLRYRGRARMTKGNFLVKWVALCFVIMSCDLWNIFRKPLRVWSGCRCESECQNSFW